jgi:hypothetical protein
LLRRAPFAVILGDNIGAAMVSRRTICIPREIVTISAMKITPSMF